MPELPHFAWPMRFQTRPDGTVGYALVEQDTPDDLLAAAAIVASTPRGTRDDDPEFGITPLVFSQGDLQLDQFANELAHSDPRLDQVAADQIIDLAAATARTVRASLTGRE